MPSRGLGPQFPAVDSEASEPSLKQEGAGERDGRQIRAGEEGRPELGTKPSEQQRARGAPGSPSEVETGPPD